MCIHGNSHVQSAKYYKRKVSEVYESDQNALRWDYFMNSVEEANNFGARTRKLLSNRMVGKRILWRSRERSGVLGVYFEITSECP